MAGTNEALDPIEEADIDPENFEKLVAWVMDGKDDREKNWRQYAAEILIGLEPSCHGLH